MALFERFARRLGSLPSSLANSHALSATKRASSDHPDWQDAYGQAVQARRDKGLDLGVKANLLATRKAQEQLREANAGMSLFGGGLISKLLGFLTGGLAQDGLGASASLGQQGLAQSFASDYGLPTTSGTATDLLPTGPVQSLVSQSSLGTGSLINGVNDGTLGGSQSGSVNGLSNVGTDGLFSSSNTLANQGQSVGLSSDIDLVVTQTNQERQRNGLQSLQVSPELMQNAQAWADNVAQRGAANEHSGQNVYENACCAPASPISGSEAMQQWIASPEHHANMLEPGITTIGVGVGTDASGNKYWYQQFR